MIFVLFLLYTQAWLLYLLLFFFFFFLVISKLNIFAITVSNQIFCLSWRSCKMSPSLFPKINNMYENSHSKRIYPIIYTNNLQNSLTMGHVKFSNFIVDGPSVCMVKELMLHILARSVSISLEIIKQRNCFGECIQLNSRRSKKVKDQGSKEIVGRRPFYSTSFTYLPLKI